MVEADYGFSEVAARLRHDVEILASGPRNLAAGRETIERARAYVEQSLSGVDWEVVTFPFRRQVVLGVSNRRARFPATRLRLHRHVAGVNLVATRRGVVPPYVLIGAHLDTVVGSPGADDNASGIAVLLELGRRLSHTASVMIAIFDLEEFGFLGARALARHLAADDALSAMICLESVGAYSDELGAQRIPHGLRPLVAGPYAETAVTKRRADFLAVVHRRSSAALANRLCDSADKHGLATVRVRDPRPDGIAGVLATAVAPPLATLDRSDHTPFWRRRIPSLMLTDTANLRNSRYHTPADTPDSIDYNRLAELCATLCDVLDRQVHR